MTLVSLPAAGDEHHACNRKRVRVGPTPVHARISWTIATAGLATSGFIAGCYPNLPRAPTVPQPSDAAFTAADEVALTGLESDPAQALTLYPGDVITLIMTSSETDTVEGLTVDETGMVHVPLAGDVRVGGLALTAAETALETALHQYDRTLRVTVLVSDAQGHQATVVGAVEAPGRFPVIAGMRLADLIGVAGGPARSDQDGISLSSADLSGARLVREGQTVPVSLTRALEGDPHHNIRVRPGDVLYVPSDVRRLVTVLGQVSSPQVFVHRPGMRLLHAVAMAGGVTRDGNWGDVRVIRGDPAEPRVYGASVADIVDGRAPDVVLAPGDIVYVASAGHADLRDVLNSITAFLSLATTGATVGATAAIVRTTPTP